MTKNRYSRKDIATGVDVQPVFRAWMRTQNSTVGEFASELNNLGVRNRPIRNYVFGISSVSRTLPVFTV